MKLSNKLILTAIAAFFGSYSAMADEGMWMINAINEALEKKMHERGLELSANEIYNADAPGTTIADAIVSMEFGCTGSMISDQGLLITNHHCAYGARARTAAVRLVARCLQVWCASSRWSCLRSRPLGEPLRRSRLNPRLHRVPKEQLRPRHND